MSILLETTELTLAFGGVIAANNINFQLNTGERLAVIGQNGAGKTTFINMCTGYVQPDSGSVYFAGRNITGKSPRAIVHRGMARSFQLPQLFTDHSVRQCLELASAARQKTLSPYQNLKHSTDQEEIDQMLELVELSQRHNDLCGALPEGQRKLLDVAMSLMLRPQLLIMDEPTSGVATEEKYHLMAVIMTVLEAQSITTIFVEHDIDIVQRYATRVAAWISGEIAADNTPDKVFANPVIQSEILGN